MWQFGLFVLLSSSSLFILFFVFSLSMSHCRHSISLFYIIIQERESQTQSKYLWTVKAGAVEQRRSAGQCWSSNRRRRQDGSFSRGRRHGVGSKMGLSLSLSRLSLSFLFFSFFFFVPSFLAFPFGFEVLLIQTASAGFSSLFLFLFF